MERWDDYTARRSSRPGAFVAGEGLQPSTHGDHAATSQDGERILTDGPFAETKEQIGGYYMIDCKDLDEAIDWARQDARAAQRAAITEIRPVMDYELGYDDPQHGAAGGGLVERSRNGLGRRGRLFRQESGRAVATLIRILGDFDLAEDAVQEAFVVALERWPRDGLPDNPGAWIVRTARNRAIDRLRRERRYEEKLRELERADAGTSPTTRPTRRCPDDRLRLFFTCCHPALGAGGARGADAAHAGRAVHARGRARVPDPARPRCSSASCAPSARSATPASRTRCRPTTSCPTGCARVLAALYLIFNEGYLATERRHASCGASCATRRSAWAGCCAALMPDESEVRGLLALMLLHHSRRDARVDEHGELVLLERPGPLAAGTRDEIAEGVAARGGAPLARGPYALQAAIAAEHVAGADRLGAGGRPLRAGSPSWRPRRWSSSTGRWPWRWPTGRRPGSS